MQARGARRPAEACLFSDFEMSQKMTQRLTTQK